MFEAPVELFDSKLIQMAPVETDVQSVLHIPFIRNGRSWMIGVVFLDL